jgi:hypothetical protein
VVALDGGPPWRPVVDGHVAHASQSFPGLRVIPHGDAEEPGWVQPRIDWVYLDLRKRLADRATTADPNRPTVNLLPLFDAGCVVRGGRPLGPPTP